MEKMHPHNPLKYSIEIAQLQLLFEELQGSGYTNIGPVLRDGAIMLKELKSFDDLATDITDIHGKGHYSIDQNGKSLFSYVVGPQSFKKFLQPPRRKLWSSKKTDKGFKIDQIEADPPKMAFWGVRNCDLAALEILAKVFLNGYVDSWYAKARQSLFIIAVSCTHPSANCFCTSMGSAPRPDSRFDLLLTEVLDKKHYFILGNRIGTGTLAGSRALATRSKKGRNSGCRSIAM